MPVARRLARRVIFSNAGEKIARKDCLLPL
jgi:hypothetical protein